MREGVLDQAMADSILAEAKEEAAGAGMFADESRSPGLEDIAGDVYWESDHQTPASRIGRHQFEA